MNLKLKGIIFIILGLSNYDFSKVAATLLCEVSNHISWHFDQAFLVEEQLYTNPCVSVCLSDVPRFVCPQICI